MDKETLLARFTTLAERAVNQNEEVIVSRETRKGITYEIPGVERIYCSNGNRKILVVAVYSSKLFKVPRVITLGKNVYRTKEISSDIPDPWVQRVSISKEEEDN